MKIFHDIFYDFCLSLLQVGYSSREQPASCTLSYAYYHVGVSNPQQLLIFVKLESANVVTIL